MPKRKTTAACLCLLVCFLLTLCGCGRADPGTGGTESGPAVSESKPAASESESAAAKADRHVILHTAAGDYVPVTRPTWSLHNGIAADALPILPQDAAEALTEDMWLTLPLSFDYGEPLLGQSYDIYTLPGTKPVARGQAVFTPPEEEGAYLCVAKVTFGTEKEYDGCQYVFAFGVGDVAYTPYAAEPPMGGVVLHGADGDFTPTLRLLLDERYGGIVTEMPPIRPEEAAEALTDDMWVTLPAEIGFDGPIFVQSYEIYTLKSLQVVRRSNSFKPPEETGAYLCIAKADFRGDEKHACWQYFFAFEVR